ncbi:hypothetical protein PANDA_015419 [Ailuropoda melanoleuca]|uniref:C2H2-type domain-containing protein n=1 Tax=Ailuropoda melanoleuca TaxID=9646 RepID=D2HTD3_AILME|nr:hypothetical protein PANDA_015419 [Ailuropoda melanoleuca]
MAYKRSSCSESFADSSMLQHQHTECGKSLSRSSHLLIHQVPHGDLFTGLTNDEINHSKSNNCLIPEGWDQISGTPVRRMPRDQGTTRMRVTQSVGLGLGCPGDPQAQQPDLEAVPSEGGSRGAAFHGNAVGVGISCPESGGDQLRLAAPPDVMQETCGRGISLALPLPQGLLQSPDSKLTLHDEPEAAMAAKFTCSDCGNNFPASSRLLHTGEQPYICSECGKRFTQSSSLIQQRKIHLAEKPHLGVECGCGSSQHVHLISHPANALRGVAVCSTSVSSAGKPSARGLTSPDEPM